MKAQLSLKDFENISAYLDGQLSSAETRRMEELLKNDPEQQAALQDMAATRTLLRSAPRYRAPRNFTLTPEMARQNARRSFFPALPSFRFSAAMASLSLIAVFVLELSGLLTSNQSLMVAEAPLAAPAMAPAPTLSSAEKSAPSQNDTFQPEPTLAIQWDSSSPGGFGGGSGGGAPDQPELSAKPQFGVGGGPVESANNPLTGPVTLPPSAAQSLSGNTAESNPPSASSSLAPNSTAGNPILGLPSQDEAGKMISPSGELQDIPEAPAPQVQERLAVETVSRAAPAWLNPRRYVELGLVVLALLTGISAIYFRRKAS